jgi:hypothetical protein
MNAPIEQDVLRELGVGALEARDDALRVLFVPAFHSSLCVTIYRAPPPHAELRVARSMGPVIEEAFVDARALEDFDARTRDTLAEMGDHESMARDGIRVVVTSQSNGMARVVRFDNGNMPARHRAFIEAIVSLCESTFELLAVRESVRALRLYTTQ